MKYTTATPYIASYVLLRDGNKVAMVLRTNTDWMNNHYGLPSGKTENGESFAQGAIREAKEEVGVTIDASNLHHALTVHRRPVDEDMTWVDMYFEVDKWEGQVVNAEPHMHSEVAWLDINDLPDNVIPAVVDALGAIKRGEHYLETGWE